MSVPTPILQYNLSDASVKGLLPSGYTPLAYVEFTNANRLINTGITSNNNLKFESKWGNLTNGGFLYGSANSNDVSAYANVTGTYNWRWGGIVPSTPKPTIDSGINYIEQSKDGVRVNGVLQSTYSGSPSFNSSEIGLFGRSDSSTYYATGRCYYFKIWNNGSLVRDFVPCINSSNVVGLYDLVGRLFYSPSSNVLKAGPELAIGKNGGKSLPEEYLLVEYLQMAPGLYINTGQAVAASDVTKTEAWMWYASGSTRDLMGWSTAAAEYWGCTAGNAWEKVTGVSPITQRQKVTYNYTATTAGTYQIGALVGSYSTRTKYIEQVKITIGGSLKRNLYACYRKSDMKPGMYDVVNGVFYTNAGSGEFILGPSITNCYTSEPNAGSGPNLVPNWRSSSSWTNDGSTLSSIIGDTLNITYGSSSTARIYYNTSNVWTEIGAKYTVSGWIRSTSGTATVRFSRSVADYGTNISATTTWQKFSTTITTTATSDTGTLSILPNANILIKDLCLLKSISNKFVEELYVNCNSIYDSSKGWVADFTNNTAHLSSTIPAIGNNFSVAWWELSSDFNNSTMPWGIYPFNPLYSKCLNTADGSSNPWYKSGTTTAIDNITNNTWHHFVITGNGSANYLYVDGVKYGLSKTFKGLTGTLLVINGWQLATPYCRNPKIFNFQIFNVALTDAQVKELYGK